MKDLRMIREKMIREKEVIMVNSNSEVERWILGLEIEELLG